MPDEIEQSALRCCRGLSIEQSARLAVRLRLGLRPRGLAAGLDLESLSSAILKRLNQSQLEWPQRARRAAHESWEGDIHLGGNSLWAKDLSGALMWSEHGGMDLRHKVEHRSEEVFELPQLFYIEPSLLWDIIGGFGAYVVGMLTDSHTSIRLLSFHIPAGLAALLRFGFEAGGEGTRPPSSFAKVVYAQTTDTQLKSLALVHTGLALLNGVSHIFPHEVNALALRLPKEHGTLLRRSAPRALDPWWCTSLVARVMGHLSLPAGSVYA